MKYIELITVEKKLAKKIKLLEDYSGRQSYDKYGLQEGETLSKTIKFADGMEMDIKLIIAPEDDTNWTEAVLFDNKGCQVAYTEPEEVFFGEWQLENNGNTYTVIVK